MTNTHLILSFSFVNASSTGISLKHVDFLDNSLIKNKNILPNVHEQHID